MTKGNVKGQGEQVQKREDIAQVECYKYKQGTCPFGNKCRYIHREECWFFKNRGICKYGNECKYWHKGITECKFYERGSCRFGKDCRYHHTPRKNRRTGNETYQADIEGNRREINHSRTSYKNESPQRQYSNRNRDYRREGN